MDENRNLWSGERKFQIGQKVQYIYRIRKYKPLRWQGVLIYTSYEKMGGCTITSVDGDGPMYEYDMFLEAVA